jgi:hypothetical protein
MSVRSVLSAAALPLVASLGLALGGLAIGACRLDDANARPEDPDPGRIATTLDTSGSDRAEAGAFTIDGPFDHENLSLFLVRGASHDAGAGMMTLEEAMEAKKLVVYETGDVNELEVENVGDTEIFIQASEIVKGGQQDRALAVDMIVPPNSGRVPIAAFCVEHGRWSQRGGEAVGAFSSSKASLNSKELKMAARYHNDQSKVWSEVEKAQDRLAGVIGSSVADTTSATSLQLTLENESLEKLTKAYVDALAKLGTQGDDVIGYAFAINGSINSAEVYASPTLFRKLWMKMLRAAAAEAVGERGQPSSGAVTAAEIAAVLADAEKGTARKADEAGAARGVAYESDKSVLFETRTEKAASWVHRSYVTK